MCTSLSSLSSFFQCHFLSHSNAHFSFMILTLCSFFFALFISLLWLSILAPNSTICTLLFSANSSFKLVVATVSQLHIALCQLQSLCNLLNFSSTLYILTICSSVTLQHIWCLASHLHFTLLQIYAFHIFCFFCLHCFFLIIFFAKVTMNIIEKKGGGEDATQSREKKRAEDGKDEGRGGKLF